jgi:hypothetical protein
MRRLPAFILLAAMAACSSAGKKRSQVVNCSAISLDAPGIARCLVAQYRWSEDAARTAGVARQAELDSIARFQRDSLWSAQGKRHHDEARMCADARGDIARCLVETYGWDDEHAAAAFDSVWRIDGAKHAKEVRECQRKGGAVASCLMLFHKWDPKHALAVDDSIARAKIKAMKTH